MGEEWTIGDLFNRDYLHFYEPRLTQQSDEQAALIWDLLGLREGSKVLDLACGHGRIANRLAERGAHVTGLDATVLFLDLAREEGARGRGIPGPASLVWCVARVTARAGAGRARRGRRAARPARTAVPATGIDRSPAPAPAASYP